MYNNYFKQVQHAILLSLLIFSSSIASAAGLLTPVNSKLPSLEIRSHEVNVIIEDGFATTAVEQVFHNPNGHDLEALYSFPVPDKAAVGEFIFWIDGKPVIGEVVEKNRPKRCIIRKNRTDVRPL